MTAQHFRHVLRNALIIASGFPRKLLGNTYGKRVICLHDVKDAAMFRRMLLWLKSHYDVVSVEELFEQPIGKRNMVTVTFDDGYDSWHELAAPVLEKLQVPATFFVCSGFVGLSKEGSLQFLRTYTHRKQELYGISVAQLSELANHPLFEIGGHTVHHVDLGQPLDENTLSAEILDDRKQLEDWTGQAVRWFAYPFGMKQHISQSAVRFLKQVQFSGAFTLIPGFLTDYTNRYWIGRDGLDIDGNPRVWDAWLRGDYDFWYRVKERIVRWNYMV